MQTSDATISTVGRPIARVATFRRLGVCLLAVGALTACEDTPADTKRDGAVTSDTGPDVTGGDTGPNAARWGESRYGEGRFSP